MNNFPFYQQFNAEIIMAEVVDAEVVDKLGNKIIEEMQLTVVDRGEYNFAPQGITKYWILSQSHLVIHSWPESKAIHIDLITCSHKTGKQEFEKAIGNFGFKEVFIS